MALSKFSFVKDHGSLGPVSSLYVSYVTSQKLRSKFEVKNRTDLPKVTVEIAEIVVPSTAQDEWRNNT